MAEKIRDGKKRMKKGEFHFCPYCGSPVKLEFRFGKVRSGCSECNWVHFVDPKVAVAVVLTSTDGILLIKRDNSPFRGSWTLPAGFVDGGEDPRRAAERECKEETGLVVEVQELIDIYYGKDHERGADFVLFYGAKLVGGNLVAGDDASDAKWYKKGEYPELAFRSTSYILDRQ
jgi:8-oxo-dGTP diphosphatase